MKEFVEKLIGKLEEIDRKTFRISPKDAIEIVNHLAEEYNNDVCEWKWGVDYAQVQCRGDRILFGSRRLFTYCPYCGKKIKVVE